MHSSSRNGARVIWLAVHTTEGFMRAVDLRAWTAWPGSSHAANDETGVLLSGAADGFVDYDRAAWTLRKGNPVSDNLEQCGWARWTRAEWLARPKLLDTTARWLADRHKARPWIPLVKLSPAEVAARKPGVLGHGDYSTGTGDGTHWDPGPGFPWDVVLDNARAYAAGLTPGGFLMALSDERQEALAREITAIWRRSEGFLRQRYYVVENGAKREVAADHVGAIPAAALDTLDGDYLVRLIQSAATKAIADAVEKLPAAAAGVVVDKETLLDALRELLREGVGA